MTNGTTALYVDGQRIERGTKLHDFRGDTLYFVAVVDDPQPGKSGKCRFVTNKKDISRADGSRSSCVFYPSVVDGEIRFADGRTWLDLD